MPLEFKGTVMKVGNGLLLTIPKPICDGYKIQKGDVVTIRVEDDKLTIPLSDIEHRTIQKQPGKLKAAAR